MARSHKQDFQQWVQRNNVTVLDTLQDAALAYVNAMLNYDIDSKCNTQ